MDPFSLILILVLLFFAYYKKRESDGNPLELPPWLNQILGIEEEEEGGGGGGGSGDSTSANQIGDPGASVTPGSSWDITTTAGIGGKVTGGTETTSAEDCVGTWGWSAEGKLERNGGNAQQEEMFWAKFEPGAWSTCNAPCGQYGRTHQVLHVAPGNEAKQGGNCTTSRYDTCYGGECADDPPLPPPQDCVMSGWYQMGECSKPCGGGEVEWRRHVEVSQAYGGTCDGGFSQTRLCNDKPCITNCVGQWIAEDETPVYSHCSGNKKQYKQRFKYSVTVQAQNGGSKCADWRCNDPNDCKDNEKRDQMSQGRNCSKIGHWVSLENETGIVADLLRNPYIEVSEDDVRYILNKVNMGKFNTIKESCIESSVVHEQNPLPIGSRNEFEETNILEISECESLIETFEDKFNKTEIDQKLSLDQKDLENVIGKKNVEKILCLGDTRFQELQVTHSPGKRWILRRSMEDRTMALPFHRDWDDEGSEYVVVGVNLNTNYSGGVMMYLCNDKLNRLELETGNAIIHDASTIHAVSPITAGIRYKLFYILSPPKD